MSSVNVALVGCGFSLHTMVPAFRAAGACVSDLVGREAERTAVVASRHDIPRATTRLEVMLEHRDVDLVCIVTPPDLHRSMAEEALAAGKHVLCEKPMALDAAEAESMCRAAERSGRLALIDHQLRFHPNVRRLRRLVADGYIGTPLHADVVLRGDNRLDPRRPFNWWSERARGGGVLGAFGSHLVDLLRSVLGEVARVCAVEDTYVRERPVPGALGAQRVDADDYASLWLEMGAPPCRAAVTLSVVSHHGGGLRLELFGTGGMLALDAEGRLWGSEYEPGPGALEQVLEELSEPESVSATIRRQVPDSIFGLAFLHQALALVPALGGPAPALPEAAQFRDGLAVQRVLDAARRSSEMGGWVSLSRTATR